MSWWHPLFFEQDCTYGEVCSWEWTLKRHDACGIKIGLCGWNVEKYSRFTNSQRNWKGLCDHLKMMGIFILIFSEFASQLWSFRIALNIIIIVDIMMDIIIFNMISKISYSKHKTYKDAKMSIPILSKWSHISFQLCSLLMNLKYCLQCGHTVQSLDVF